ncbi:Cpn60 TCP1 domain containing protein [Trichuris trichiura]|uniref:Cpn60 TCP1 domain containing protein n=1 Tax=Trichuris trichiura TaxID=36087 RepID=A0A077Z242_TRITR|nr:Cpn60 TCP1 domain containing protein [Trichuris trichiura]
MASLLRLNPKAEYARSAAALEVNALAARGLLEVMKTNLGPKGTVKMLISGSGGIKLTKDGNVLLNEMQITHPTATLIAKASTAQNDITGDGTSSIIVLIGEMLKQAEMYVSEGVHPRIIFEGFEIAKDICLKVLNVQNVELFCMRAMISKVLESMKISPPMNRELLMDVARTSLRTKVASKLADHLTEIVVDAVLSIQREGEPLDLHMVEIMEMHHQSEMDTALIRGLVLDHGARHPDMKKHVRNAYILICNVALDFEKTDVNTSLMYKTSTEREAQLKGERAFVDNRVKKIIELKRKVCAEAGGKEECNFVVINQKGIDPLSLDMFVKEGIVALRRAKRRNMERLPLACGGVAVNSVDNLTPEVLGRAGLVYEHVLGEDKFTFIEECENPKSVTILIKGPNQHSITQIKDAIYDGLRAVKNTLTDGVVLPGAGAFEVAAHCELMKVKDKVDGRKKLGVQAYADALMVIVKSLAENAGHNASDAALKLVEQRMKTNMAVGINLITGDAFLPEESGIYDNYCVKKNMINSCSVIASNLLLVDEILRSGMSTKK